MPNPDGTHAGVRPRTAVLTAGFDPHLSFGSARPAVFRSSTYVFSSPEEAERAFSVLAGRVQPEEGERADLIYSRFSIRTPKSWKTKSYTWSRARKPPVYSIRAWPPS